MTQQTGFTCGAFDLLHPGHLHLIQTAQQACTRLILGLQSDPTRDRPETKVRPVQTLFERWMQLQAVCRPTDRIIPYDTEADLVHLLATQDIQVRFLGTEYRGRAFTGEKICAERGIEIVYVPRWHTWSSTELRERLRGDEIALTTTGRPSILTDI